MHPCRAPAYACKSRLRRICTHWVGFAGLTLPLLLPLDQQMLVDDIGDVTITNDGATILKLLEVEHPAAKASRAILSKLAFVAAA